MPRCPFLDRESSLTPPAASLRYAPIMTLRCLASGIPCGLPYESVDFRMTRFAAVP
jgi:hypothetical protein